MKKFVLVFMAVLLIFNITASATETLNVTDEVSATENYYLNNRLEISGYEEALALAQLGYKIDGEEFSLNKEDAGLVAADIDNTDGSEIGLMSKFILVALSSGKNPSTYVEGKDLVAMLIAKQGVDGDFGGSIYSHFIAMLALDAAKADYNKTKATEWLISQQDADGGFGYWGYSDTDSTAMMLWALAGHRDVAGTEDVINGALSYIKTQQAANGGFLGWVQDGGGNWVQEESASTDSVVITALVDLGKDPFSLEYKGLANRLLAFKNTNGSYRISINGEQTFDGFSTAQTFFALVSMKNGRSPFKMLSSTNFAFSTAHWNPSMTATADGILMGVAENTSIEDFLASITLDSGVTVKLIDKDLLQINDANYTGIYTKVGTGVSIEVYVYGALDVEKSYTVSVKGDLDGDCEATISDLAIMKQHLLLISELSGAYLSAGDLCNDTSISISDLIKMKKHILGIDS